MRRRLLLTLFVVPLLVGLCSAADANALVSTGDGGWFWQNALPHGNPIVAIDFVDAQHGWALSSWGGRPTTWWATPQGGQILCTRDGGRTWAVQYHGYWHLSSIFFHDRWTGWAVGEGLLHTTDGGRTWSELGRREGTDIDFVDEQRGWIVAGAQTYSTGEFISHTTDGGTTWTRQWEVRDWNRFYGLEAVDFVDDLHGWAVGREGRILHTEDGGATWMVQQSGTWAALHALGFVDEDRGWVVGDEGTILATVDGGGTWVPQQSGTRAHLTAIEFVAPSCALVAGADGVLLRTSDDGRSWAPGYAGTRETVADLDFVDPARGWLATGVPPAAWMSLDVRDEPSDLFRSDDGGFNWSRLSSRATSAPLDTVDFVSRETGWVIGDEGLLKSVDGGLSWTVQAAAGSEVADADFVDEEVGWLVDSTGAVSRTHDGGDSWTTALPGPTDAREVEFRDRLSGWAADDRGLWFTEDGGASWERVDLRPPEPDWSPVVTLRDIVSERECWVLMNYQDVPDGYRRVGQLYHTTDAGVTWVCHDVNRPQEDGVGELVFHDLEFRGSNLGYAVGFRGSTQDVGSIIYRTTDGGLTWSEAYGGGGLHPLRRVRIIDEDTAWAAGDSGTLTHTTDGGATWHRQEYGSLVPDLRDLFFVDATYGWIVGENGTILHTVTGGESDATPPITTQTGADEGWHNSDVTVQFAASDPGEPYAFGVAFTEWALDGGPWTDGSEVGIAAPADHSNDGAHELLYRSRDNGGNLEEARSCRVRIDTTPPEAALPETQRCDDTFELTMNDALSPTCSLRVQIVKTSGRQTGWPAKRGGRIRPVADFRVELPCSASPQEVPLPPGLHSRPYLLVVTATDLAGNRQAEASTGVLRVR